jgi:hypothetical protein
MKSRITDCPLASFVEARAELRLSSPFRSQQAVAQPRRATLPCALNRRPLSPRYSKRLIDPGIQSQQYIQNP